jgi:Ricin-type beta-trefoil lectin domain
MSSFFRILALGGFLLVTTLGLSSAHAAIFVNAQTFVDGQPKCIEVGYGADGSQAFIFPCTASFFQMWDWEDIEIRGLGTTNLALKCLDVQGGGMADNTLVQLFTCNGTGAQRWYYAASGQIINPPSGKCLDLDAIPNAGLVEVVIFTCNSSNVSQQWLIQ